MTTNGSWTPEGTFVDKRAFEILSRAFWTSAGWRPGGATNVTASDFEYAKEQGVMFDEVRASHSEVINELISIVQTVSLESVSRAFVASLSTRLPHRRSAVGSLSVFRHLETHEKSGSGVFCEYCGGAYNGKGEDLNMLSFERIKWGGVRHEDPLYALLDLRQFSKEDSVKPSQTDVDLLNSLVQSIKNAPAGTTAAAIHRVFPKSLASNKSERDVIVQLLAFAGILSVPEHPGYNVSFVPHCARELPDRHFVDMAYPAAWWHSSMGLDDQALRECFGRYLKTGV